MQHPPPHKKPVTSGYWVQVNGANQQWAKTVKLARSWITNCIHKSVRHLANVVDVATGDIILPDQPEPMPIPVAAVPITLLGNNLGYTCPSCGKGDELSASATIQVRLTTQGLQTVGQPSIGIGSIIRCRHCMWASEVYKIKVVPVTED